MLKLFEMFSGYGGASFALKKAEIPFECVGFSEIDKYAIECYNQNHCKNYNEEDLSKIKCSDIIANYGDCTKINPNDLPDFDLLTGGFPCQSFSNAGNCKGELDTRGTLFNEIIRIAEVKKPKYMLLENVKGLISKRHKKTFEKILSELKRIGYFVDWQVLNSKEHGIPQNRERVFFVCFRSYEDLIDSKFFFPKVEKLKLFLKDLVDKDVDEKYYLKQKQMDRLIDRTGIEINVIEPSCFDVYNKKIRTDGISITLTEPHHNNLRLIEPKISFCIDANYYKGTNLKGYLEKHRRQLVFLPIKNATKKGYLEGYPGDGVNLEQPDSKTRRGRIQKDVIGCLQTNDQRGIITCDFRIRKFTPEECFRFMGFLNNEINLDGLSNTQRYKLAGNGWDINLVSKIFKEMFATQSEDSRKLGEKNE